MTNKNFTYKRVDACKDEEFNKFVELDKAFDREMGGNNEYYEEEDLNWLRIHLGATEYAPTEDYVQAIYESEPDEVAFLCEFEDKAIGYIYICPTYLGVATKDTGYIYKIYVDKEFRTGEVAYQLLQLAFEYLLKQGKTKLVMEVNDNNPQRFIHFALADELQGVALI